MDNYITTSKSQEEREKHKKQIYCFHVVGVFRGKKLPEYRCYLCYFLFSAESARRFLEKSEGRDWDITWDGLKWQREMLMRRMKSENK